MEVFMDYFQVLGYTFKTYIEPLVKVLQRCIETKHVLNYEKCHFMVNEGIVLRLKILGLVIQDDQDKFRVITKLSHLFSIKDM